MADITITETIVYADNRTDLQIANPRDTKMDGLSADRTLKEAFARVLDQRDAARQDLKYALDTIKELERHNEVLNSLLTQVQEVLEVRRASSMESLVDPPNVEVNPDTAWIDNTWLCSSTHDFLLGKAEEEWKLGNPQRTINMMFELTNNHEIDFEGRMLCRLLVAAVFHSSGKIEQSMDFADDVLKSCELHRRATIEKRQVTGIAQFIRGKNFMSTGNWSRAYWAFSRATATPYYQAKARQLKTIAADHFPEEEKSTHLLPPAPLFSRPKPTSKPTSDHSGFEVI